MFPGIPHSSHTLPEISLEQFEEINESELNCIFAETGADREVYFNRDNEIEKIYLGKNYMHLVRTKNEYIISTEEDKQDMIDFETDEMQSMGHTQTEIDEHIKWKFYNDVDHIVEQICRGE